ncbi:hypothetical protein CCACVL1_30691 [Corchorus capsularis]|uniref:Uncharacterized protein n=1 Tax=Corchorus capsularis TaxID=210143 RepID=A0A1R3FW99_COCAP|nr:hypothetical protein CCACVL1_30691 [Corchorus capsularis]
MDGQLQFNHRPMDLHVRPKYGKIAKRRMGNGPPWSMAQALQVNQ